MKSFSFIKLATGLGVTLLTLGLAQQAHAANNMALCVTDSLSSISAGCNTGDSVLLVSDGTTITPLTSGTVTITNYSTGANHLVATLSVGVFTLSVSTGTVIASAHNDLDLNFTENSTGAGSVYISFMGWPGGTTGFTVGAPFSGHGGGTTDGISGTFLGCYMLTGAFDTCTGLGPAIGSAPIANENGSQFGVAFQGSGAAPNNPFGLAIQLDLTATGQGSSTGDLSLVPAPEPTSILLFGGALAFACGAIRRKIQS